MKTLHRGKINLRSVAKKMEQCSTFTVAIFNEHKTAEYTMDKKKSRDTVINFRALNAPVFFHVGAETFQTFFYLQVSLGALKNCTSIIELFPC